MLNIEKYKDEIINLDYDFALMKNNSIVSCSDVPCHMCKFDYGCKVKKTKWLMEEYKELILSEDAKNYLLKVVEPYDIKGATITKLQNIRSELPYCLCIKSKYFIFSIYFDKNSHIDDLFKQLEFGDNYTYEELGL